MMTREMLIDNLLDYDMVVTFTKKDGAERVMFCTLSEDIIIEASRPEPDNDNRDLITVFDIERDDWRSFNYSSVTDIAFA